MFLGRGDVCTGDFNRKPCKDIEAGKCTLKEAYECQKKWCIQNNIPAPYNTPFNFEVIKESELIEVW